MNLTVDGGRLTLSYQHRGTDGEWRSQQYPLLPNGHAATMADGVHGLMVPRRVAGSPEGIYIYQNEPKVVVSSCETLLRQI
jgi:hypothetical protein